MKNLKKKLTSKVVGCPSCHQKIRIPIRPGKSLEVRCQKCTTTFQINFQTPFKEVFQWNRSLSFVQNVMAMKGAYQRLPQQARLAFIAQSLMLVVMLFMLVSIIRTVIQ